MYRISTILITAVLFSTLIIAQNKPVKKAPVIFEEKEQVQLKISNSKMPEMAADYVLVDFMQNAFGPAISSLNPLVYDPWSDVVAVVHRGALSYSAASGQLWYNISTNKGSEWARVSNPINTSRIHAARYPSMAISNHTKGNIGAATGVFSWPELTDLNTFGWIGYGGDQPLGGGSTYADTITGPDEYSSQAPIWTNDNNDYIYWTSENQTDASITLFITRIQDFGYYLEKIKPPQWDDLTFQGGGNIALGGASFNGVQYYAVLGTFDDPDPANPIESGWYPAYSKSTDNGFTWSEWKIADFRTIPGLTQFDRLWDWKKGDNFISYQGDMIVDNQGYVHLILGVTDTMNGSNSGNNAIIEVYETADGWKGKIIAELGTESDNTDWTYGILDQCGYSAYLARSADGSVLAAQWAVGSGPNNLVDLFYSYRAINGEWVTPVNITNTPFLTESISHMAPQLAYNGGSSYSLFSMFAYDATGAVPPNDISITNLYIAPVTFYLSTQPSLHLIKPNGGEQVAVGTTYEIKWVSSLVSDVKIEYSTDAGTSWITIVSSLPGANAYNWLVPNTPSANCLVKISDVADPGIYDISDNPFYILESSISIISPNGGENWQVGTRRKILWNSTGINNVKIEVSVNNGTTWNLVVNSTPGDGEYEWLIPNTPSTECRIKISDVNYPSVNTVSGSEFSINQYAFYASIQTNPVWIDSDYDGLEVRTVNGSGSFTGTGSLIEYRWYVNGMYISNQVNPNIELVTGTNVIKLVVKNNIGQQAADSVYVSVYSSKLSTGGAIFSGISQLGNNFYVTSMNNGVYRIDSTGSILQSYMTGGSIQSSLTISSKTNLMYVGSSDTRLYCFDVGLNSIWDKGLGGVANNSASVNYNGDVVYVGANDNNNNLGFLKSLIAVNGNPRWTFQVNGRILSSPVVMEIVDSLKNAVKTIIYFGTSTGKFYAVEDMGTSADLLWLFETSPDSAIISSPAISGEGMIYIGSANGYLYRFNWDGYYQSGWKKYLGGAVISSPVIDENGVVFIASASGYLSGFEKDFTFNSNPLKTFYLKTGVNGTAGIGPDGTLLIGLNNGKFYALDKNADGPAMGVKWYFQASDPIYAPTLVTDNGIVYIGTVSGDVFVMSDPGIGSEQLFPEWPTFKGDNQRSKVVRLSLNVTSADDEITVSEFMLYQNYPNPFNPTTKIKYQIPYKELVVLKVYDVIGNEIATLVNKEQETGSYDLEFNAVDLSSGIYFFQVRAGSFLETKKMILLK
jgi:hypothetical protein